MKTQWFDALGSRIGDYFGGSGLGSEVGAMVSRLASGLRGLQSSGGKMMRQKRGQRSRNSTPTSNLPADSSPTSTTSPRISSPDLTLRMVSNLPRGTFSTRKMSAPCALTTE